VRQIKLQANCQLLGVWTVSQKRPTFDLL